MKRALQLVALVLLALAMGCQNLSPTIDGPVMPKATIGTMPMQDQNPVFIPLPKHEYGRVMDALLRVLYDYGFEIAEANRYSGHIEAVPRIAPGILLAAKPGSPDLYDRLLSTAQTYRHRLTVIIQPADPQGAEHGGYFVEFVVRKELEVLMNPIKSSIGVAAFRNEQTVDRQTEVIDAGVFDPMWLFRGRDVALEQELIRRFKDALARCDR